MNAFNLNKKTVQEGAQAQANGNGRDTNPYSPNCQAYNRWERGYDIQRSKNILVSVVPVATAPVVEPVKKKKNVPRKAAAPKADAPTKRTLPKKAAAKKTVKKA
jgi:hypothetical protein